MMAMAERNCDTTLMNNDGRSAVVQRAVLGLLHRGRQYHIRPGDTPFVIGRDTGVCDLSVANEYGSRRHCVIEYRDAKFVLRDNSTNGTYVQLGRADSLRVHHETIPLVGQGCFMLGKNFRPDDPDLIHFVIRDLPD